MWQESSKYIQFFSSDCHIVNKTMASWNLRSGGAVKALGSLPPPKKGRNVADMDKFMASELAGAIINEKRDKSQASSNLGFLIDIIFATFKEDRHRTIIQASDLMVTPSTLKGHASSFILGITMFEHDKPAHLYDSRNKQWNWAFPSGNSTTENEFSNEAQIALFLNTVATAVANSVKVDNTPLSSRKQRFWMADWSSQCMTGSTGYKQKPDLVLVSSVITSRGEVTWLSPKVVGEYSREPFQPASRIRKTMDTKAYLVMVEQPWRRFVLGLSLANDELRVHFYDRSGGSISPPFNIHAEPDSFLYILSGLVFGIRSCIGFDMSIKLTPPPMNSRKAHLTALLSAALETPGGDSIVSPSAKSERSTTDHPPMSSALESSQPLAIGQPPSAALLESQLPSGNLAPLFMLKPSISIPELSSSSPETMPSIGTIQVGEIIYDIMDILFSSTGFLGRGTVCYLVRRDREFYVIKDHWVQNELKRYQNPLQEVNMMKLVQGIDGVPVLVDFWMVEVLPGVPDVTQRYRQEKWW